MDIEASQHDLYGCDIHAYAESARQSLTFQAGGPGLVVSMVLSEAHELIHANPKAASQLLNRAKFLLNDFGLLTPPALIQPRAKC
jgi:hypothetical protein